ncbi:MAG: hypothetical protein AB1567_07005 [bacterium]
MSKVSSKITRVSVRKPTNKITDKQPPKFNIEEQHLEEEIQDVITTLIIPPIGSSVTCYNKTNSGINVSELGQLISIDTENKIMLFDTGSKIIWQT